MITCLAGGVGAARFLEGLVRAVPPADITVVVNTGDDTVLHGLHISPDLDTVTYTLAGAINREMGWGLEGESWAAMDALERYGGETWFRLGDRDLATHLYRTHQLGQGSPLSEVTDQITRAWGLELTLLPMTDDRVATRIKPPGREAIGFQEWFVGERHATAVESVTFEGIAASTPAPGVIAALTDAEVVVVCPSNPIVSIGPILEVPGVADTLSARRDSVVAVSPIIAGKALKGPADTLMTDLGHEASVVGVARLYARVAATLVVDEADADQATAVEAEGMRCVVTPTVMTDSEAAAVLAATVLGSAILDAGR
jgi:LPPG:FO 2-phospho-L-lactate transferase